MRRSVVYGVVWCMAWCGVGVVWCVAWCGVGVVWCVAWFSVWRGVLCYGVVLPETQLTKVWLRTVRMRLVVAGEEERKRRPCCDCCRRVRIPLTRWKTPGWLLVAGDDSNSNRPSSTLLAVGCGEVEMRVVC